MSKSSLFLTCLTLLAACGGDPAANTPDLPGGHPELAASAFQLTIDVGSGAVRVTPPAMALSRATGNGLSLSLLGSEAVGVTASDCTLSAVPKDPKKVRCTLSLAVTNRLGYTDLVTASTFPRPPQGVSGILVFPFSAAALGVPGNGAVPTSDWNVPPTNFFNDFGTCGSGGASDCYRSELYPSPLYAGTSSPVQTVGFDIDKASHIVSAYIVVAANLRDNPRTTIHLAAERTGRVVQVYENGSLVDVIWGTDAIFAGTAEQGTDDVNVGRGFVSFPLSSLPAGTEVVTAKLRLYQEEIFGAPYTVLGHLIVDALEFGTLDDDDFGRAATTSNIGALAVEPSLGYKELDVTSSVQLAAGSGLPRTGYRLRFESEAGLATRLAYFSLPSDAAQAPELVITYRLP